MFITLYDFILELKELFKGLIFQGYVRVFGIMISESIMVDESVSFRCLIGIYKIVIAS